MSRCGDALQAEERGRASLSRKDEPEFRSEPFCSAAPGEKLTPGRRRRCFHHFEGKTT